jgi:hypothetical protein
MRSRIFVGLACVLFANSALADGPAPVEKKWHPEEIGAGLLLFAAGYVPSLFVATIGYSDPVKACDASGCHNPYWPLLFPVVGPLASLATMGPLPARTSDWVVGLLVADTLAQASGLVLAVLGFVPTVTLASGTTAHVTLAPSATGVLLQGTF